MQIRVNQKIDALEPQTGTYHMQAVGLDYEKRLRLAISNRYPSATVIVNVGSHLSYISSEDGDGIDPGGATEIVRHLAETVFEETDWRRFEV